MIDRIAQLSALLPQVSDDPRALIAIARQMIAAGDRPRALALAEQVHAMTGGRGEAGVTAAEILSDGVFSWHFIIPRDRARNDAYEQALRRAIRPGSRVLEIGTGTGLLAMMAARAGAHVVTCEADPAIASAARDVVAANGYADRVTVVNKHSTDLDPIRDMGGLADILVSEIVSNDLLSEGVLAAHEDAVARLLAPDAVVIPARGTIRVALARDLRDRSPRLCDASGFDLTAFNRLALPNETIRVGMDQVALCSEPVDLFSFDFATAERRKPERREFDISSFGGRIDGIVQWIALTLDPVGRYENRPEPGAASCWAALLWRFPAPVDTKANDCVTIGGAHERDRVRLWVSD
ncbi:type II protein arginine methyltransferase [Sphingomonas sp. BE123]|uniref:50S ribosomal protein L11 methyltransferase n=1 Tax=Sphingomonas sp. BE123 TaxID=2817842 RepID=UPI00286503C0|nr:50S ribosomal protein L11 methyltransferase [Sphingomonas sp. BE123]MDR6850734.1 type II protein arginine methyltransferase [Sphingomonas sp. BE123]